MNQEQAKENKLAIRITQDEIDSIEKFNLDVLKEATRQAELKINDENDRKERIDKRVSDLFPSLALMIIVIFNVQNRGFFNEKITTALGITGLLLFIPVVLLLKATQSRTYGALGTFPSAWLHKEFLESNKDRSDQDGLGWVLSHLLYQTNDSILTSDKSNELRLRLLNRAINFIVLAIVPVVYVMAEYLFRSIF